MNIVAQCRQDIAACMAELPGSIRFRVDGTVLFQSIGAPHDITTEGAGGHYPRVEVQSANQALAIVGASEGANVYKVRPMGDLIQTPEIGALMDARKSWEIQLGVGAEYTPARVLSITPDQQGIGWDVMVEAFPQ